jgi:hypothetical protein
MDTHQNPRRVNERGVDRLKRPGADLNRICLPLCEPKILLQIAIAARRGDGGCFRPEWLIEPSKHECTRVVI